MLRKFTLVVVALLALTGLLSLALAAAVDIDVRTHARAVSRPVHDAPRPIPPKSTIEDRYLEMVKCALTRYGLEGSVCKPSEPGGALKKLMFSVANRALRARGKVIADCKPVVFKDVEEGNMNRILTGETMVGLK